MTEMTYWQAAQAETEVKSPGEILATLYFGFWTVLFFCLAKSVRFVAVLFKSTAMAAKYGYSTGSGKSKQAESNP